MKDIVRLINLVLGDDHKRNCDGRTYSCTCGYDLKVIEVKALLEGLAGGPPPSPDFAEAARIGFQASHLGGLIARGHVCALNHLRLQFFLHPPELQIAHQARRKILLRWRRRGRRRG